jgi:trigger factor
MEPGEFIKVLDQNGQLPAMIGEVARAKALASVLSKAKVVDTAGKAVDVSALTEGILAEEADGDGDLDAGDATALLEEANAGSARGAASGAAPKGKAARDSKGRKPGNEHYGHDHS